NCASRASPTCDGGGTGRRVTTSTGLAPTPLPTPPPVEVAFIRLWPLNTEANTGKPGAAWGREQTEPAALLCAISRTARERLDLRQLLLQPHCPPSRRRVRLHSSLADRSRSSCPTRPAPASTSWRVRSATSCRRSGGGRSSSIIKLAPAA